MTPTITLPLHSYLATLWGHRDWAIVDQATADNIKVADTLQYTHLEAIVGEHGEPLYKVWRMEVWKEKQSTRERHNQLRQQLLEGEAQHRAMTALLLEKTKETFGYGNGVADSFVAALLNGKGDKSGILRLMGVDPTHVAALPDLAALRSQLLTPAV